MREANELPGSDGQRTLSKKTLHTSSESTLHKTLTDKNKPRIITNQPSKIMQLTSSV